MGIDISEADLLRSGAINQEENLAKATKMNPDEEKVYNRGLNEKPEKKEVTFTGVITDIDPHVYFTHSKERTRYIRLKIDKLWFTLFERYWSQFKGKTPEDQLKVGDNVRVQYWCSESSSGRTYRNINLIHKSTSMDNPETVIAEVEKMKKIIESNVISIEKLGNAIKKLIERVEVIENECKAIKAKTKGSNGNAEGKTNLNGEGTGLIR
jgi:hypothetical protein